MSEQRNVARISRN